MVHARMTWLPCCQTARNFVSGIAILKSYMVGTNTKSERQETNMRVWVFFFFSVFCSCFFKTQTDLRYIIKMIYLFFNLGGVCCQVLFSLFFCVVCRFCILYIQPIVFVVLILVLRMIFVSLFHSLSLLNLISLDLVCFKCLQSSFVCVRLFLVHSFWSLITVTGMSFFPAGDYVPLEFCCFCCCLVWFVFMF